MDEYRNCNLNKEGMQAFNVSPHSEVLASFPAPPLFSVFHAQSVEKLGGAGDKVSKVCKNIDLLEKYLQPQGADHVQL